MNEDPLEIGRKILEMRDNDAGMSDDGSDKNMINQNGGVYDGQST